MLSVITPSSTNQKFDRYIGKKILLDETKINFYLRGQDTKPSWPFFDCFKFPPSTARKYVHWRILTYSKSKIGKRIWNKIRNLPKITTCFTPKRKFLKIYSTVPGKSLYILIKPKINSYWQFKLYIIQLYILQRNLFKYSNNII